MIVHSAVQSPACLMVDRESLLCGLLLPPVAQHRLVLCVHLGGCNAAILYICWCSRSFPSLDPCIPLASGLLVRHGSWLRQVRRSGVSFHVGCTASTHTFAPCGRSCTTALVCEFRRGSIRRGVGRRRTFVVVVVGGATTFARSIAAGWFATCRSVVGEAVWIARKELGNVLGWFHGRHVAGKCARHRHPEAGARRTPWKGLVRRLRRAKEDPRRSFAGRAASAIVLRPRRAGSSSTTRVLVP
mmetsp:Transcript_9615/g.34106  ORF Transcript_9615/g.34106 Transcript_9615/m.34106 type:complete len:243 (+) Transcript_9615:723-1451(+)